jgi:hypothetical protein
VWYPNARYWTLNSSHIIRSPNRPVATPVAATIAQNTGVRAASPSLVMFGCSMAPRPDGSLRFTSGCGLRRRSLSRACLLAAVRLSHLRG